MFDKLHISSKTEIILTKSLDEPFSALDYQTRLRVGDDIGLILKKEKKNSEMLYMKFAMER